jgi:ribulose-phosphate 3-epimerase
MWSSWVRGVEVEPSVYAADFTDLGAQVERLLEAGTRIFHVDVGDGHFIEPITIGPVVIAAIAPLVHRRGGVLDCHLMVDNPERHFGQVARSGGDSVTFHAEVVADPAETARLAREQGLGVGVAFNPETEVAAGAAAAIEAGADLALCMSVHPGYSGQEFLPQSYERFRELRARLPAGCLVQVDGGIKLEHANGARKAGADLIVVGSAVFGADDVAEAYGELARAVE